MAQRLRPAWLVQLPFPLVLGLLALACGLESAASSPNATATFAPPTVEPTAAPTRQLPPPTPTPEPSLTPQPELQPGEAIVVGGEVRTRSRPSSQAEQTGILPDLAGVEIVGRVVGENWLVGLQTWPASVPDWSFEWFELADGNYVYGPFVFILREGERSPLMPAPEGVEKWIDVDVSEQVARAMVGEEAVFTAPMSSGAGPFETPLGTHAIESDGRIVVERMTASQAGYDPNLATYDVERVLFTQYFDRNGNALHLNYWRPHSVFGQQATSHGCVGLELHEAQYLWLFAAPGMRVEIHE